jgi:membrane protein DedA with SNARE-associated domain
MASLLASRSVLVGAAAAVGIANAVGIAFAPSLLKHSPLLLIALSPLGRHLVLAATVTPQVPFVLVGTARRMLVAAIAYALGRAYGGNGIAWVKARYPKLEGALVLLERLFARAGLLLVLFSPNPMVCALAGATGVRAWVALPLAAAGHTGWMLFNYKLGEVFAVWLAPITAFISAYTLPLTLASIALVLVYQGLRRRRRRRAMHETGAPSELGRDPGSELALPERTPAPSSEHS